MKKNMVKLTLKEHEDAHLIDAFERKPKGLIKDNGTIKDLSKIDNSTRAKRLIREGKDLEDMGKRWFEELGNIKF